MTMAARSIPERIRDFLVDRRGRAYCDDCVQQRLGLKWRQQVQVITATLAVTGLFSRGIDACSTCRQTRFVIRAVPHGGAWPGGQRQLRAAEASARVAQ
jgi:hypothetical protein